MPILLFLLLFHASASRSTPADWPSAPPHNHGLDPARLTAITDSIAAQTWPNIHSLLIARHGTLVLERYFPGTDGRRGRVAFTRDHLHDTRSVTKSVTSLLVGIALDRGLIDSVDAPIAAYFPQYAHRFDDPRKRRITVRHLLTMTAGIDWDQSGAHNSEVDSPNPEAQMENSDDFVDYVLSRPMAHDPGARFKYNSGCAILLAGIVEQASGMRFDAFADRHLFEPLGITEREWWKTPTGLAQTHAGLRLRPIDLANIGQLYVDGGEWQGQRIVSEPWIAASFVTRTAKGRYGYTWWLDTFRVHGKPVRVLAGEGNGGQFLFVIPDLEMVIVFTGGNYGSKVAYQAYRITTRHILPAVVMDHPKKETGSP